MLLPTLKIIFNRDLTKLKTEISSFQKEEHLWLTAEEITNSAGNLCLHLVGNLNTYIGAVLGNSGYIRQRDLEFSLKHVPVAEMIRQIEETIEVVNRTLDQLQEEELEKEFPMLVFAEKTTTNYMLVHLTTHLTYHLGQINYHRRLLDVA